MEEALKKMEKKEKRTLKGTARAVSLAQRLSPKSQRKKDLLANSTAQLKVCFIQKKNFLAWLFSKKRQGIVTAL